MASNRDEVLKYYRDFCEDERATSSRANELEFHYTSQMLAPYIGPASRVIELGCATGYYGMRFAKCCAQYTGVDPVPDNIEVFSGKIQRAGLTNVHAVVGDATALSDFADDTFDVVLCLGPMYHLPAQERQRAFDECRRISRPGAVLAFAYINAIGAYAAACVHDDLRATYPTAKANRHVWELGTDDQRPGLFFFTSPEEIERDAQRHGMHVRQNRGVDFSFAACAVDNMGEEQFRCYRELADRMHESPSCTGLASHALLICRK